MNKSKNKKYTFTANDVVKFQDVEDVLIYFTKIGKEHYKKYNEWRQNDHAIWRGVDSLSYEHNGELGRNFLQLMHNVAPEFSVDYFAHKQKSEKHKDDGYSMYEWNQNLLKQQKFAVRDWQIHGDRKCSHNHFFWKTMMYFFDALEKWGFFLSTDDHKKMSKSSGHAIIDHVDNWYDKMCDQEQKDFWFAKEYFEEEADNGSN